MWIKLSAQSMERKNKQTNKCVSLFQRKKRNCAVRLETKQKSICAIEEKIFIKTKQWCQAKTKAAFIGLWH